MARRTGGRAARVAERTSSDISEGVPAFIKRQVRPHDLLNEDGLDLIERKADQLLAEVGIDVNETQDRELFRSVELRSTANRCGSSRACCARS